MMKTISNNIFFEEVERMISEGQSVKITVQGSSMSPTFRSGRDWVILKPVERSIRRGRECAKLRRRDIVLFRIDNTIRLHRIINMRGTLLCIRGDGCYGPYEKATTSDVIAVVSEGSYHKGKKHFQADSFRWRVKSKMWTLSYPYRRFIVRAYHKLWK